MRTAEDIKKDIEVVKRKIFYEEMADYINWATYRSLKKQLSDLENELEEERTNDSYN